MTDHNHVFKFIYDLTRGYIEEPISTKQVCIVCNKTPKQILSKMVYFYSPKTPGHKISIRQLKDKNIKVIHKFPNNERIITKSKYCSFEDEIKHYSRMGYIQK